MKQFKRVIKLGIKFQKRKKIINRYSKQELIKKVNKKLPHKRSSFDRVLNEFEKDFLPYCVNQGNPKYLAFPDSGNYKEAIAADILKTFLNQNLIADVKSAPIGTYLEIQLIDWFRQLIGYKRNNIFPNGVNQVGGVVCFGGVMSIVTSLLVARSYLKKDCFINGFFEENTFLLIPENIDHYSKELSLGYLGIGTKNVVRIKINNNFKMNTNDLQEKISSIKSKGGNILAVVAYAGDSRVMSVDDLKRISKICKIEKIWLHVDACHGGSLLFSKKLRNKLAGIRCADSITLDPHKILGVPYPCSLALFKRPEDLLLVSKNNDMTIHPGTYDLGQISPFIGSKSFESLKLWFLLKTRGKNNIGKEIERRFELAKYFKKLIDLDKNFVSLNKVEINSLAFIFLPPKLREKLEKSNDPNKILSEIDRLNQELHDKLYQNGEVCIHTFKMVDQANKTSLKDYGKRQVLGVIIGNYLTNKDYIKKAVEVIKNESKTIWRQNEIRI